MSHRNDREVEQEITTDLEVGDKTYEVTFRRLARVVADPDYGADADGRRGVYAEFIEDDRYEDVFVSRYDEATDTMSEPVSIETCSEGEREAIEAALDRYLEKHEIDG